MLLRRLKQAWIKSKKHLIDFRVYSFFYGYVFFAALQLLGTHSRHGEMREKDGLEIVCVVQTLPRTMGTKILESSFNHDDMTSSFIF